MPEVRIWRTKGEQFFDDAGDVLNGGYLEYDQANSDTNLTVYTDKDGGNAVSNGASALDLDAYGRLSTAIYIPIGTDFKETLKNSAGTTIFSDVEIQEVESGTVTSTAIFAQPVKPKATTYSIIASDAGKLLEVDPSSASFVVTLLDEATAGDGFRMTFRHSGTANKVAIVQGTNIVAVLSWPGQVVELFCDGASYTATPMLQPGKLFDAVNNTLVDNPASPAVGAFYIIASSGTTLNDWASYANNDIVWTDGTQWNKYTPGTVDDGLIAKLDSGAYLEWTGTAWRARRHGGPDVILVDRKGSTSPGGTATSGSWETRTLNRERYNPNALATLSSNQFTLPAGTYLIEWVAPAYGVNNHQTRLYNVTDSSADTDGYGSTAYADAGADGDQTDSHGSFVTTIGASKTYRIEHRVNTTNPTSGYGAAASLGGGEIYTRVHITRLY